MSVYSATIPITTRRTFGFTKLTENIEREIEKSEVQNGVCVVWVPHTTCALVVTEDDMPLHQDTKEVLQALLPHDFHWHHTGEGVTNAIAHQIAMLLGTQLTVPIKNGKLALGTWQDIFWLNCLRDEK